MTTSTLANVEYPDEMPGNVALHQVLPCLSNKILRARKTILFENYNI